MLFPSVNPPNTKQRAPERRTLPASLGAEFGIDRYRISRDVAIPTIECPRPTSSHRSSLLQQALPSQENMLHPSYGQADPKTPQKLKTPENPANLPDWSMHRSVSVSSTMSDSSMSSASSLKSPSVGSCTSPEVELQSEAYDTKDMEYPVHAIPFSNLTTSPKKKKFTNDMDNHLWNTYQTYIHDPRVTPFKTHPGSIPPLGVTSRVAREAVKSWPGRKGSKGSKNTQSNGRPSRAQQLRDINDDTFAFTGLTEADGDSFYEQLAPIGPRYSWPRSQAATRARLKELCRQKFSIGPHYQRLMESRSPSPDEESLTATPRTQVSTTAPSSPFATRDLGITLATSTADSMQPEGFLAQLSTSKTPQDPKFLHASPAQPSHQEDWFNTPFESSAKDQEKFQKGKGVKRLASPFMYNTWGPEQAQAARRVERPVTPINQHDTMHVTGPRLLPAIRLQKRRALAELDEEVSPSGSNMQQDIEDMLAGRGDGEGSKRRVRVRNRGRGVTVSGLTGESSRLDSLFAPPSLDEQTPSRDTDMTHLPLAPQSALRSRFADPVRLGSPIDLKRTGRARGSRHASRHSIGEALAAFDRRHESDDPFGGIGNQSAEANAEWDRMNHDIKNTLSPVEVLQSFRRFR